MKRRRATFLWQNRGIATHIINVSNKATKATTEIFGGGLHYNNDADAFRHCYGAALLTRDIGVEKANEFLDLHESAPTNPPLEKIMDDHNNDKGMAIAQEFPPYYDSWQDEQFKSMCVAALHNGELIRNLDEARNKQIEEENARPKWWSIWSWWSSWSWSRR